MPIHLHPTARLAERALLPGDPGRALALAQELLERPLMFNHNRGLWGYTGEAKDDSGLLTIQSTGMGGPSAAIVLEELIELGLRRGIRVGTCAALAPGLALGDLLVASAARATGAGSSASGAARVPADPKLTAALSAGQDGIRVGAVHSTDIFYDDTPLVAGEALAVEMEAATLFTVGRRRGVAIGCALAVSDLLDGPRRLRLDESALAEAGLRVGRLGLTGLNL